MATPTPDVYLARSRSLERAIEELVYTADQPPFRVDWNRRLVNGLIDIVDERRRQERIGLERRARGETWRSCADPDMEGGDDRRLAVLTEELGEVARALLERQGDPALRAELIQVAAVSLAWVEAIDEREPPF